MSAFVARRGVRRPISSRVFLHPGEVDEHARFVPDHPGVVAGWDDGVAVRACAATCFPSGALASAGTPDTAHLPTFPTKTTPHPAQIPQEVAGGSRLRPVIPARPQAKRPAREGNPRLLPLSPKTPRPACHAGGRGFESRRSRKVPANRNVSSLVRTCTTAGFSSSRAHPAPEVAGQRRLEPQIPAGQMTGQVAGRPSRVRDGNALISSGFVDARRTARVPSRSGRAPHGASARLTAVPPGRSAVKVWLGFSHVRSAPSGCSSAAGFDIRLGDRYRRLGAWRGRQLGARIDSVGDCPCAAGCEEGFALSATAGA